MKYIEIIQGDTYTAYFNIYSDGTAIDYTLVSKVYVTSNEIGLQQEVVYENSKWKLTIPASTTKDLKVGNFTYDLTIKFTDASISTGEYEGSLIVLAKHNEVDYE